MPVISHHVSSYLSSVVGAKGDDMTTLHQHFLEWMPGCRLWFLDGRDSTGKVVSNPNIGYGERMIHYADGSTREFYRIGLSANSTGISVYIMDTADKNFLSDQFISTIGKAKITGYCIRFRKLSDIDISVLKRAVVSA
jgi:hypothetical protein